MSVGASTVTLERSPRRLWGLVALVLLTALAALASLFIGSRPIPVAVTLDALLAYDPSNSAHLLVHHLRVPRTLLALVVGAALGVAGALMQGLTRNPLADPGLFGVNAGATTAIVAAIAFFGVDSVSAYTSFGLIGAALAALAVYRLGGVGGGLNPVRVVLAGAAITVVLLAITHLITLNSDVQVFDRFRHWAVGSLQGRGQSVLLPITLLVVLGLALSLTLARALDTVALGEDLGRSLGVHPVLVRSLAALAIVVLAGAATAAAGPISFIGLTAPHLARFIVGPEHRWLLPYALVIAALLVVMADVLGRVIGYPGEIGVGIMVALLGGPFFVVLVRRWRLVQL
ncbi:ABC transporter permease [Saccharospirillum sp. MSK14-1]|uniref:FecCD family ABC transporter permease n=1 Tax=Saccharospirillum sp. MSK14-1 TaxID=1897632 RepID=UPI000D3533B5|nr:iron ABC transporter permease [Saccharospirillum sp. MSK14-1]PTY38677.1 ABC transporter permease [Saccharospirillum sp. MSK14-1]